MPPPIPLSGAAAWYSGGSQSGSASSAAKRGLIASHAASGDDAPAIVVSTSATNARTTCVSRTSSPTMVVPLAVGRTARPGHRTTSRRRPSSRLAAWRRAARDPTQDTPPPGRRKDVHGLAARRGVAGHGRALVPRAAAAPFAAYGFAAGTRRALAERFPFAPFRQGWRPPFRGVWRSGRAQATAHHAHDPGSCARRRLGHHAADRGTPLGRRPERRPTSRGSPEPVVPARFPLFEVARAGRSRTQHGG